MIQPLRKPGIDDRTLALHAGATDSVVTVTKVEASPDWIYAKDTTTGALGYINSIKYPYEEWRGI